MTIRTLSERLLAWILAIAVTVAARSAVEAESPKSAEIAPDRAILILDVPAKTTVHVDDKDQGTKRQIEYTGMQPGQLAEHTVRLKLPGGEEIKQTIFLKSGWEVRLPRPVARAARPELVLQTGHGARITTLAFSPDGKYLLTGSEDKTAILWNAATGQQLRKFQGHAGLVSAAAFDADSKRVLTGSSDRTAILWDVKTGARLQGFRKMPGAIADLAFSPKGDVLAFLCNGVNRSGDKVILWDLASAKVKQQFVSNGPNFHGIAFSADGRELLTGGARVTAWDVERGQRRRSIAGGKLVEETIFSADRRRVLVGAPDNKVALLDAASGRTIQTFQLGSHGHPRGISPDGSQVLIVSPGSGIKCDLSLFDVKSGRELRTWQVDFFSATYYDAAFSSDGRHVLGVVGETSTTAVLWDAAGGREAVRFQGHIGPVNSLAAGPGGRLLVGSKDFTATLWDTLAGRRVRSFKFDIWVESVALSPDGKHAVIASHEKKDGAFQTALALWDTQTGEKVRDFRVSGFTVMSVAFSPDGKQILAGSQDSSAVLFDAQTGQRLRTFRDDSWVESTAFVPGTSSLITASNVRQGNETRDPFLTTVKLWDSTNGKVVRTFSARTGSAARTAIHPDGKQLLTAGPNHSALLWDMGSGEQVAAFGRHAGPVTALAFSPDGRQVLTGSEDKLAAVWDARTAKLLRVLRGHTDTVKAVAFAPDGRQVFTGSADGTVRLWDLATGAELAVFINLAHGADWLAATPEGLFDGSAGGRQQVSYRIGGGLNVVPVDRFFQDFYRPGLLAVTGPDQRPRPEVELGHNSPPQVKILTPTRGGIVEESEVTLEVEARDEGGGVQGPWLIHNEVRVRAPGEAERRDKVYRRRFSVSLVQGDNRLEVHAACADGSQESEPAVLVLRYEKPLPRPHLYLIVVGVSKYAQGSYRLKYARADAESLRDLFKRRGGVLYGKNIHIEELFDDKATKANIQAALNEAARKARPQDTLMLFLAGHGTMVGQRYYFIPHEFRANPGKEVDAEVRRQALPADLLGDFLQGGAALKRMLILDTCASGGTVDLFKVASRNPFAFRAEIERLSRNQGLFILAASAATEEAKELEKLGHGVLSYTLLAGLSAVEGGPLEHRPIQPASPSRVVDVLEWFGYAAGHVPRLTREYCSEEQNVHMSGKGSSFPVLPVADP